MKRLLARLWHRPWLSVAGLILFGVAAGLGTQVYAWYQLRAGRVALERYHTGEARRHLDACLHFWPESSTAHLLAARAARRAGDYAAAQLHLDACPNADKSGSGDEFFEWALLRAVEGDLLEVEDFLRAARAARDPAVAPLVWEALAEGNARMYRVRAALELLDRWLDADPDNARALYLRGNVYREVKSRKALDDYRRVLELDADNDSARWWLALALQDAGQFDEALRHLEQLRDRGWPDRDLRVRLARSLDRVGRTPEARALLDAALADDPDHGLALRVRGQVELMAGDLPAAEKWLRAAVRVQPADYQTHYTLIQCLRQEQKDDEARTEQEIAERLKVRQERLGELRSREMSLRPHDPALHCRMGVLLDSLGYTELAERWLASALHEDANYRPAHAALADFYERHQREPEQAEEHRKQARGARAPSPDDRPEKKS